MNTIDNIFCVVVIIPVMVAFVIYGRKTIKKTEEKYYEDLEKRFLDKKKE